MDLRPYLPTDRDVCLKIFDSLSQPVSASQSRVLFEQFLASGDADYFVMEHDGAVVGCGGFEMEAEPGLATLVWGMVRRDFQKMGLGRFLLMYRLREIGKRGGIDRVRLDTPEVYAVFFLGQGFKVVSTTNGLVQMVKKLTVCP